MKRYFGLLVSEIFTAGLVIVVLIGVGFGLWVSAERDAMVEQAEASLAAMKERIATAVDAKETLVCDNTLVDPGVLANDFLTLTVKPVLVEPANLKGGYTAGVWLRSEREADGNDTFETASRLLEAIEEDKETPVRIRTREDDELEYTILLSEVPVCNNR